MSWNRTKYDTCAYRKELSQSTSPIYYTTDPTKYYNQNDTRINFGILGGNNVSVTKQNMINLENDLFGLTRQNSLCPEKKYIPNCQDCCEISGNVDPSRKCPMDKNLQHLKESNLIDFSPRIDHIGYNLHYPAPPRDSKLSQQYPPQLNPTRFNPQQFN